MSNTTNNSSQNCSSPAQKTKQLAFWTFTWLASTALLVFGTKYLWHYETAVTFYALTLNLALGAMMIKANIEHIKRLDELQRKITLEAMGVTLGVGLLAGIAYGNLQTVGLITFTPEIGHLVMLMAITYITATLFGHRRYQ